MPTVQVIAHGESKADLQTVLLEAAELVRIGMVQYTSPTMTILVTNEGEEY